jgi:hypothetical protein
MQSTIPRKSTIKLLLISCILIIGGSTSWWRNVVAMDNNNNNKNDNNIQSTTLSSKETIPTPLQQQQQQHQQKDDIVVPAHWREEAFDSMETSSSTILGTKSTSQFEFDEQEQQQQQQNDNQDDIEPITNNNNNEITNHIRLSKSYSLNTSTLSLFSSRNLIAAGICLLGAVSSIYALLVEQFKLDRASFSRFSVATKIPVEVLCLSGPLVLVSTIMYILLSALILLEGSSKYVFFISASWSAIVIDMSFVMYESVSDVLANRIDLIIHIVNACTVANSFSQLNFFPYTFILSGSVFWLAVIIMRILNHSSRGREHEGGGGGGISTTGGADAGGGGLLASTLLVRRFSGIGRPSSP